MSEPSDWTKTSLTKLKVADLKELCKEHGLTVSGKKADLVERLLVSASQAMDEEENTLLLTDDDDEIFDAEVLEPESIEDDEEILDATIEENEPESAILLEDDDEVFEAEIMDDEPLPHTPTKTVRLERSSFSESLTRPATIATILAIFVMAGGGYWYWMNNLDPFIADPIEYGDSMEFAISSGSFDVEGEEMIRELDERLNGALADVCDEFHVEFSGTGSMAVSRGKTADLLNPSDTHLIGAVQARDAYGLNYLGVQQTLSHDLTGSITSKSWLGSAQDGLCSVPVGPISGYGIAQSSVTYTELTSKALLSTETSMSLDNQGDMTTLEATSFGIPEDTLADLMPELLLPLKPVELTPLLGNAMLEEGSSGTSGGWKWIVAGRITTSSGEVGLQVNLQHIEVQDCIGRANMVLHVLPNSPWPVHQQVDIHLEKSRYDSPNCGAWTEFVIDQTLPDGSISLQYTLVRSTSTTGEGMIDWGAGYGGRPGTNAGALSANENWGGSGLHMPDRSEARDWPLEDAVNCILNNSIEAEEASSSLATGGYVFQAVDDRSMGTTSWNVSWVDDDDAGWVLVEERTENCSVIDKGSIGDSDKPPHRRDSIPATASLQQLEERLVDQARYPSLVADLAQSGVIADDATLGYLLTVPPEAGDILELIEGYQSGTIGVYGQREWSSEGMDHRLDYAIDATTGRMVGWAKTSSNS